MRTTVGTLCLVFWHSVLSMSTWIMDDGDTLTYRTGGWRGAEGEAQGPARWSGTFSLEGCKVLVQGSMWPGALATF